MARPFYLAPAFVFQHLPPQPPLFEFKFDFNFLLLAAVFRGPLPKDILILCKNQLGAWRQAILSYIVYMNHLIFLKNFDPITMRYFPTAHLLLPDV